MAILVYDSSLASDLVPSAQIILLKEAVPHASGSLQSPDVFESKPCSHGSSGPSSLGRVTPCAPFVNGNRRAEDFPPYQVGPATGRWLQVRGCYESLPVPLPLLLSSGRGFRFRRRGGGRALLTAFGGDLCGRGI